MPDHKCPFTLGQLMAIWAAIARSPAAGVPTLQAAVKAHIDQYHAHDTQEEA